MENRETTIMRLSHDGRGIAQIDGKTTFVFGALAGEDVSISYLKKKSKYDEAKVEKIHKASTIRVQPRCDFFGLCGGCSLQHLDQNAQISFKQNVLLEQLQHFGKVSPLSVMPPLVANAYGYRRKARYSVRYIMKKERILVGFREMHHPRYIAEISSCQVLHPRIGLLITPLQECFSAMNNKTSIAQVEVAVGDENAALVLRHLEPLDENDRAILIGFAKLHDVWLYLQPGKLSSIHKVYPHDGRDLLSYVVDDIGFDFHPVEFTQVNAEINQLMIKQAVSLLDLQPSDVVLDLFCGLGNFSLPMARRSQSVTGIEGERSLVNRAQKNAEKNGITNAQFLMADLNRSEELVRLVQETSCNKILIDPPRSGAEAVVSNVPLETISTLVYVSCNPATLARDAGILCQRGMQLISVGVMDMFTHTEHVEAMALFTKVDYEHACV